MNKIPRISVVIATYNRSAMVARAVDSILAQTHQDFKVIVSDDGSTDNTPEVMRIYERADPRVKYVRCEQNIGNTTAYNRGLEHVESEYVAFLDDDDELVPDALETYIDALDHALPEVGIVYGWYERVIDGKTSRLRVPNAAEGSLYEDALRMALPTPQSVYAVRRQAVIDSGGFDLRHSRATDQRFIRDIVFAGYHVKCIPQITMIKHDNHGSQKTTINKKNMAGLRRSILDHIDEVSHEFANYPYLKSYLYLLLAFKEWQYRDPRFPWHLLVAVASNPRFVLLKFALRARNILKVGITRSNN